MAAELWHIFETKRGCETGHSLCGEYELPRHAEPSISEVGGDRQFEDCEACARRAGLLEAAAIPVEPAVRVIADGGLDRRNPDRQVIACEFCGRKYDRSDEDPRDHRVGCVRRRRLEVRERHGGEG